MSRKPASTQPQPLPRLRTGWNLHLDRTTECRHGHRGAQRGFPRCDRKAHRHITAVELVLRVWLDMDLQVQVPRRTRAARRLALPRQAHQLSLGNPRGNVDAYGARAQLDRAVALDLGVAQLERARRTAKRLFKIQLHARVLIAAAARARSTRGVT